MSGVENTVHTLFSLKVRSRNVAMAEERFHWPRCFHSVLIRVAAVL